MNIKQTAVAIVLTLGVGVAVAAPPPGTSPLIVTSSNAAAANSCYTIVMRTGNVGAASKFLQMYTGGRTSLLVGGQTQLALDADRAADVTNSRINSLAPGAQAEALNKAAGQCLGVL